MSAALSLPFPGGVTEIHAPTPAQLTDSALAWLTLAQQQVGRVELLVERGAVERELFREIATLRAQMRRARGALTELAEQVK